MIIGGTKNAMELHPPFYTFSLDASNKKKWIPRKVHTVNVFGAKGQWNKYLD